jgi:hypothetical protein
VEQIILLTKSQKLRFAKRGKCHRTHVCLPVYILDSLPRLISTMEIHIVLYSPSHSEDLELLPGNIYVRVPEAKILPTL